MGDCALWSDDVGDFVIIVDRDGSGANVESRRYRGGSRWVGHQWRLRFVVGRCRGTGLLSSIGTDQGRTGTVAATAARLRDERLQRKLFGNN